VGDEPDAAGVPLEHPQARVREERHEFRRSDARPGDVREDDVRLDDVRPEAHAGNLGEPGAERPRSSVIVPDAVEHRVQRDEPRRRCDAGSVEARAAEPVQHRPRPADDGLAAGEDRAEGRREALVEGDRHGVRGRGEVGRWDTERRSRVHQPGAVNVDTAVVALRRHRERLGLLRRQRRPTGPRVGVLEDQQRRAALGHELLDGGRVHPAVLGPERRRLEPGDLDDSHRL
jgi:hypothetical protein